MNSLNWSDSELALLADFYAKPMKRGDLAEFAKTLNRHKTNVSRKARALGLTNCKRVYGRAPANQFGAMGSPELKAHQSISAKKRIEKHGHPRGMLGKKHHPEALAKISAASSATWNGLTQRERSAHTLKSLKGRLSIHGTLVTNPRPHTTWKAGWREIAGRRIYFRSRWEYNYAVYLQWLKSLGEIREWEHEPETFWFEKIKRGCVTYLPDFKVTERNGRVIYHEVKGWMDARSKTKLKRMAKYHPTVVLRVLDTKWFKANAAILRGLPGYEADIRKERV